MRFLDTGFTSYRCVATNTSLFGDIFLINFSFDLLSGERTETGVEMF